MKKTTTKKTTRKNTAKGYCTKEIIAKFKAALIQALIDVKAGRVTQVYVSVNNSKLGPIGAFNTIPVLFCSLKCREIGGCGHICYASRDCNRYPGHLKRCAENTALLILNPIETYRQLARVAYGFRFFRLHADGEFMSYKDFYTFINECVTKCPKTDFLTYTKKYDIPDRFISENGALPENLQILYSKSKNMEPVNPYNMPTTDIIYKGDEIPENYKICGGNCFECATAKTGCWTAKHGETIAFPKH